ncbi:MAG TPA: hypothetical protein VKP69_28065 [Isosphaeraceae bacterium]|nr:hypothetical protein [Isosphaeraceae bacterium]
MPRRRLEPDWEMKFLGALLPERNVARACRQAGIGRATAYLHRSLRPAFRHAWDAIVDGDMDRSDAQGKNDRPPCPMWFRRLQSARGRIGAAMRWGPTAPPSSPVAKRYAQIREDRRRALQRLAMIHRLGERHDR